MTFPKAIPGLLTVFFGLFSLPITAQLNLKTGYSISLVSDPVVNHLIDEQNQANSYTKDLKQLEWMHGFDAGIRYKSGLHAFELTYGGAYRHLRGYLANPSGGNDLYDRVNFDVHSLGLGYQLAEGLFGLGAELQYQWYITKSELILPYESFKDVQTMWATKVYLMLILGGSGDISLVISPYYIIPGGTYDAQPLQQFLETTPEAKQNKWNRLGISFIFYNGHQE
jgi:hypothetical protein